MPTVNATCYVFKENLRLWIRANTITKRFEVTKGKCIECVADLTQWNAFFGADDPMRLLPAVPMKALCEEGDNLELHATLLMMGGPFFTDAQRTGGVFAEVWMSVLEEIKPLLSLHSRMSVNMRVRRLGSVLRQAEWARAWCGQPGP